MPLTSIPRLLIKTGLSGVRLPLTAVELVTGRAGDAAHPSAPAVAFETFEAGIKRGFGQLLRDPELVDEGLAQQAKLAELQRAAALESEAAERKREAAAEFEDERTALAARREQVEQQAAEREAAIERERVAKERQLAEQARAKQAAAEDRQRAREKAVTKKEREARLTTMNAESSAVAQQKRAIEASVVATEVDEALERKKAERKSR